MLIPDYQIHNILKDFTQRLKNGHHGAEAGCQLESVVNKVAGTIMRRVVDLGEEEARRRSRDTRGARRRRDPRDDHKAVHFHYHTIGTGPHKQLRRLSLENSTQLIDRFQSLIDPPENDAANGKTP